MTLDEVLAYIHKVDWRGSVPGLSRIDTLLGMLGHPERHVKYIHVTGTNGKGSTCAMLASVLRAAGYKTGLYTSPYIFRFNERMQIDQRRTYPGRYPVRLGGRAAPAGRPHGGSICCCCSCCSISPGRKPTRNCLSPSAYC